MKSLSGRAGLKEVCCHLTSNRIGRVFFHINGADMVLLHGFIKKSEQTPDKELDLAMKRKKEHENNG